MSNDYWMAVDVCLAIDSCKDYTKDYKAQIIGYLYRKTNETPFYDWLNDEQYCTRCFHKLTTHTYKELHTELDAPCYEQMVELVCENCGCDE